MNILSDNFSNVNHVVSGFDPTLETFHKFRQRLHRGGSFAYLWTPNTGEFYTDKAGERVEAKRSEWFPVSQAPAIPASWHKSNVYFPVHPSGVARESWQRSTIGTVSAVNCIFAEVDGKDMVQPTPEQIESEFKKLQADAQRRLDAGELKVMTPTKVLQRMAYTAAQNTEFLTDIDGYNELARQHVATIEPRPSCIVHSGGGWHLYWLLKETFYLLTDEDRERAKALQRGWVAYVGGDDGAKDLARVLRPWGTHNVKERYAPNFPVVTLHHLDYSAEYDLAELEALLPEPERKTTTVATKALCSTVTGTSGELEHSAFVFRVMAAYNERHGIVPTLLARGYTEAGNGRLARPGGSSPSVAILDGKSWHHSSNDPLFEINGEHRLSSFDVAVHYDYGSDYERAAVELGRDMGIFSPAFVAWVCDREQQRMETDDWSQYVDEKFWRICPRTGTPIYVTGATDRKVAGNIIRLMAERNRITNLQMGRRQLGEATNSDGVPVSIAGPNTIARVLERLEGSLFTTTYETLPNGAKVTNISLHDSVVTEWIGIYYQCINSDRSIPIHSVTTGNVQRYLADDAFLSGRSSPVIAQIKANKKALCFGHPHYAEAYLAYEKAKRSKPETPAELIALMGGTEILATYRELCQRSAEEFLPALGTFGLLVIDDLSENPGSTRKEVAHRRGLKPSAVATVCRKLEAWGLIESDRAGVTAAKTYSLVPDVWAEVKERESECMTHRAGAIRRDAQLRTAQQHAEAHLTAVRGMDNEKAARKRLARIENKRFKTVAVIRPELDEKAIADVIYGENRRFGYRQLHPSPLAEVRSRQATGHDDHLAMLRAVSQFITQGIPPERAQHAALMAGYSDVEAAAIERHMKRAVTS